MQRDIYSLWGLIGNQGFSIYKNIRQKYPNKQKDAMKNFYMEKFTCLYVQNFRGSFYIDKYTLKMSKTTLVIFYSKEKNSYNIPNFSI